MESLKPKDTSPYGVTLAELQELCELIYGAQTPMEELSQLMTPVLSAKLSEVCEEKMFKRPKYNWNFNEFIAQLISSKILELSNDKSDRNSEKTGILISFIRLIQ